ncbi:MAG: metallophosphoesterase [Actinomycetota bacterium]|nr:metallophosphoesterase [Actinomycetota bacterium]
MPFRIRAALTAAALLAPLAAVAPAEGAFPGRNGTIVHEGISTPRGLVYLRSSGGTVRRVRPGGPVADPAFSPRGRWIAFGRGGDVWAMYEDGSSARVVVGGTEVDRAPAWSPRGDSMAFTRGPDGDRDIFRVRADGAAVEPVTFRTEDDHSPAWSSAGRLAFVRDRRNGDGDLWAVTPGAGPAERLTRGRADDDAPAWSPDGQLLAFTRLTRGRRQIHLARADGSGVRRLTSLEQGAASPAWSPDGRSIVFSAGPTGRRRLWLMRRNGTGLRPISPASADARAPDWQPTGLDPVVAAAGDVACDTGDPAYGGGLGTFDRCRQRQTSDSMLTQDLTAVLALGDIQYPDGDLARILGSFDPTWGRLKGLMWPVPGNHEYRVPGAAGYFDYFNGVGRQSGRAGTRGAAYYSFDVGEWHLIALDSQCSHPQRNPTAVECAAGSPQEQWLRADLAAHPNACTLAFWHHPLYSSGIEGQTEPVRPLWRALHEAGADVVLNGHDHAYERFAPQDPEGLPDPVRGIRQFISGGGGYSHQRSSSPELNSEARNPRDFGVLRLVLRQGAYDWEFVTDTGAVADAGTAPCH